MDHELVLTGAPELWPRDEKAALYLGPWCFIRNPKRSFDEHVHFNLAPSPWSRPEQLLDALREIDQLYDRLLPPFADLMNRLHRVNHSTRFWNIVCVSWLHHWLSVCYERYQRLSLVGEAWSGPQPLQVKIVDSGSLRPKDWREYAFCTSQDHVYNLQLMSEIIRESQRFEFLQPTYVQAPPRADGQAARLPGNHSPERLSARLKQIARKRLAQVASFVDDSMAFRCRLGSVYGLSTLDRLILPFLVDPMALLRARKRKGSIIGQHPDLARYDELPLEFHPRNNFEVVVGKMLKAHVPRTILEYVPCPEPGENYPKLWIGHELYGNFRGYEIAHTVEKGGKWMSAQHGGGYGQSLCFSVGKIEYQTSDGFITWGWSHRHIYSSSFQPLPSPMLSKLPKQRPLGESLLFVGTGIMPYFYRFHSLLQPEDIWEYLHWKTRFVQSLPPGIKDTLTYRPYYDDFGIDHITPVKRFAPSCRILSEGSLIDGFLNARVAVIDHLATSPAEAFVVEAPTILFWAPDWAAPDPAFASILEMLEAAEILFHSPEAAAAKVAAMWDDPLDWWNSSIVREARETFRKHHALTSRNWRREWIRFMKRELSDLTDARPRRRGAG
ncbi:MAG: hypothetical protein FJ118_13560 [Deltaproteobacteria bacterium]|nr:hypothetical protein [Deltaproteobacteria bacterium]